MDYMDLTQKKKTSYRDCVFNLFMIFRILKKKNNNKHYTAYKHNIFSDKQMDDKKIVSKCNSLHYLL